jgi:CDGSH-type Zn-finger protein
MSEVKITVRKNGSLLVEGADIALYDAAGNRFGLGGRTAISLCRCGQSQNKPFCDGSHKGCTFEDESAARDLPPKAV